jgi:hypothetical protein
MAFSPTQQKELDIASQRVASGTPGTSDIANIAYATKTYGYKPTTAIPADSITPAIPLNVAPQPPNSATADGMAAGAAQASSDAKIAADAKAASDAEIAKINAKTSEQTQADTLTARINELLPQTTGQAQATATAEANAGVPALNTELAQTNTAIQTGVAEYNQIKAQYEALKQGLEGQGRNIPLGIVRGQQAQTQYQQQNTLNTKAADIGLLQAKALGLQGQITAAQEAAKKAVDLKYSAIEEELAVKQAQLKLLEPTLTRQEAERAKALDRQYEKEKQATADKKAETQAVYALMVEPKYSDAGVKSTDTLGQAAAKVSTYLSLHPENKLKLQVIGSHFDENGIKVESYGFVDESTGTVTPYNAAGATGNLNLGLSVGNSFGLPTYNTSDNNPGVSRPVRNNNPGNIKATATSIKYPGVVGVESTPAGDGGNFLIFDSPASGQAAIGNILKLGVYNNINAEAAIKKYNGNGAYGAADVGLDPNKSFQSQIQDAAVLQNVVSNIARLEGYPGVSTASTPNESVAAWAKNVSDGTAKISDVPNPLLNQVNQELTKSQYKKSNELSTSALESAKELQNKINSGKGLSVIGKGGALAQKAASLIGGGAANDLMIQFDNLKSLLSLDNVKYLKGQGQVSDAERRLLAAASAKLELAQSETEFRKSLVKIIEDLTAASSGTAKNLADTGSANTGSVTMTSPDGKQWSVPADQVEVFRQNGYK